MAYEINEYINKIVWGPVTIALMLIVGMMFSIRTGFFQITKIKLWMSKTFGSFLFKRKADNKSGISPFQVMTAALGGAMGTGNIVGVATAITLGGAGAIFWMWIAAIFGMMTIFAENILGVKYRVKSESGQWIGGPMYYISQGLKNKPLAAFFAAACTIASFGIGNMAQSNSISYALNEVFGIPKEIIGISLMLIVGIIIMGGIKRLVKVTEKIIPIMTVGYIVGSLVVIFANITAIPSVFENIISSAFSTEAVVGGTGGYVIANAIKHGFAKGVFSNEAGLGSSPIVYASADTNEPVEQGMWGIFQVFIDTIIGCSMTAICILCTGVLDSGETGVALSSLAFSSVFGDFGNIFIAVSIVLFAFSTIIGWSYYGERSLEYLTKGKYLIFYKLIFSVMALVGCMLDLTLVWGICDTFNGLMALPNLIALIFLSPVVFKQTKQYLAKCSGTARRAAGSAQTLQRH